MARLYQAREALETGVVSLLERRIPNLSECHDCLKAMRKALKARENEGDLDFSLKPLLELAASTKNLILRDCMRDLDLLLYPLHTEEAAEESLQNHEAIQRFIERGEAGAALQAVSHHYRTYPWIESTDEPEDLGRDDRSDPASNATRLQGPPECRGEEWVNCGVNLTMLRRRRFILEVV